MSFLELFKLEKDKQGIVFVFSNAKRGENVGEERKNDSGCWNGVLE